jgi:L-malate glycosyltransferase
MSEPSVDTVVIVQRVLTHYRVPLFEALRERLRDEGFALRLLYGDAAAHERARELEAVLPWAVHAPCHYAAGGRLCWQSLGRGLQDARFVIVAQENRLLNNLPLLLAPQAFRVGLWGHGSFLQARGGDAPAQRFKRLLTRRADWWFAYTERSAELMRRDAPAERITVLNNAIDTRALCEAVAAASRLPRAALRQSLAAGPGPLGLYIGSWYPDKRLDLLLDAACLVHAIRPDFQLVVAGAGPQAGWLQQRVAALPWVRLLRPLHGAAKAQWLAAADLLLNPGTIGLGILDGFAGGLPLVTTEGDHNPESAYLAPGRNGLVSAVAARPFADAVLSLLADEPLRARLGAQAAADAGLYTLEAMVERFVQGLVVWRRSERRA